MKIDEKITYSIEINISGYRYSIYQSNVWGEPRTARIYRDNTGIDEIPLERELTHIEMYNYLINEIEKDLRK